MLKPVSSKNIAFFEIMPVHCMSMMNDHQGKSYLIVFLRTVWSSTQVRQVCQIFHKFFKKFHTNPNFSTELCEKKTTTVHHAKYFGQFNVCFPEKYFGCFSELRTRSHKTILHVLNFSKYN